MCSKLLYKVVKYSTGWLKHLPFILTSASEMTYSVLGEALNSSRFMLVLPVCQLSYPPMLYCDITVYQLYVKCSVTGFTVRECARGTEAEVCADDCTRASSRTALVSWLHRAWDCRHGHARVGPSWRKVSVSLNFCCKTKHLVFRFI